MLRWVHGEHNRRDEAGQLLLGRRSTFGSMTYLGSRIISVLMMGMLSIGREGRRRRAAREGHGMRIVDWKPSLVWLLPWEEKATHNVADG